MLKYFLSLLIASCSVATNAQTTTLNSFEQKIVVSINSLGQSTNSTAFAKIYYKILQLASPRLQELEATNFSYDEDLYPEFKNLIHVVAALMKEVGDLIKKHEEILVILEEQFIPPTAATT